MWTVASLPTFSRRIATTVLLVRSSTTGRPSLLAPEGCAKHRASETGLNPPGNLPPRRRAALGEYRGNTTSPPDFSDRHQRYPHSAPKIPPMSRRYFARPESAIDCPWLSRKADQQGGVRDRTLSPCCPGTSAPPLGCPFDQVAGPIGPARSGSALKMAGDGRAADVGGPRDLRRSLPSRAARLPAIRNRRSRSWTSAGISNPQTAMTAKSSRPALRSPR